MAGIITADESSFCQRERQAAQRAMRMAFDSKKIEARGKDNVVVRPVLPAKDLDSGTDNGWSTTEEWQQDWSAGSATADAYNQAYDINSSGRAEDKVLVFYGLTHNSATVDTRQVRFLRGNNATEGVDTETNIEPLESDEESRGLLTEFIEYGADADGQIEQYIDAANDGKRLVYHGWVAEAVGENISAPSVPYFL